MTKCNLEFLVLRRLHNDLIFMYKILHNHVYVNNNYIKLSEYHNTRGNILKLAKFHCKFKVRKKFFAFRTVNNWNYLNDVVCTHSINIFF